MFYSQHKQDQYVDNYFQGKENGFFLDIGAHNGISFNNTYFLEKERKWQGICFEPNPNLTEALKANRKCEIITSCVGEDGEVDFLVCKGYTEMLSVSVPALTDEHKQRINREIKQEGGEQRIIKVPYINIFNFSEL